MASLRTAASTGNWSQPNGLFPELSSCRCFKQLSSLHLMCLQTLGGSSKPIAGAQRKPWQPWEYQSWAAGFAPEDSPAVLFSHHTARTLGQVTLPVTARDGLDDLTCDCPGWPHPFLHGISYLIVPACFAPPLYLQTHQALGNHDPVHHP